MAMTKMAKQTCKNPYVFVEDVVEDVRIPRVFVEEAPGRHAKNPNVFVEDVVEDVRIPWLFVEEAQGRHTKNPMFLWKTLWKT